MYPTLWCPARAICEILKHKSSQERYRVLSSAYAWKARCTVGRAPEPTRHYLPHTNALFGRHLKVPSWLHLHPDRRRKLPQPWLHANSQDPPTQKEKAHRTRNNVGFFGYAVTKAAWKPPTLLSVCSSIHTAEPWICFHSVLFMTLQFVVNVI